MDKNKIIKLLENKIKYKGLKLPTYIEFQIENKVLIVKIGSRETISGKVYSCNANMQTDEAAFEGWCISLKHHLNEYIDTVFLTWEKPEVIDEKQKLHYNRFVYRVIRFKQMFNWFDISDANKRDTNVFENQFSNLTINTPVKEASVPSDRSSKEKQIEYHYHNLDSIKSKFQLKCINHQLPVGVKKDKKSFFTGRASAIDIWGLDHQDNLNLFDLKYDNKKVGVISELLFYSQVMYDLFVSKQIDIPSKINNIRNAEYLYGNNALEINAIKSHFLFDKLHPLVVGTTSLLNTNNLGIKFFNVQYKLQKGNLLFDNIFHKGAFQMEEEFRQSNFRTLSKLSGNKYILNNGDTNLDESIREEVKTYFNENKIDWWTFDKSPKRPTKHLVSSQIQCLNFLFPLKNDKKAVLELVRLFDNEIDEILPVIGDVKNEYIAFEFVCNNEKYLGENDFGAKRGAYCTSVDAFIFAKKKDKKILIPIEWKYTETYFEPQNKALEYKKGLKRQSRYNHLIKKSEQLKDFNDLANSPYYFEPIYELMRQTLLTEQMVVDGIADDFLHVIAVAPDNKELLGNNYSFSSENLETLWGNCLKNAEKCIFMDTKQILNVFENKPEYAETAEYLRIRY